MTANAQPPSSAAVPAVGAAAEVAAKHLGATGQRSMGRDTDAYSLAQQAKPAIPRAQWKASDQEKRATGELPTKCGCTSLTVSEHNGYRCYILAISHDTVRVEPLKDTDAVTALKVIVPDLDSLLTRAHIVFEPVCQISYKPISDLAGRKRKLLLTIEQPPAAPKPAPAVEESHERDYWWQEDRNAYPMDDPCPSGDYLICGEEMWQQMQQQVVIPTYISGADAEALRSGGAYVEDKPVSDVETWFGPKTAKRAPWGAEGETIKVDRKPYSVKNHFRRELLKQNPNADPAAVALIVLGMTIEESCEKIGVSPTIDKLQVYLDAKPEEITVSAPAAVPTFQNEVANLINEAFPLASSEYKQNVIATAIGHKTTTAAKVAGVDEVTILAAIRNKISTIKTLERNLPPTETAPITAANASDPIVGAYAAAVAKHEGPAVAETLSGALAGKAEPQSANVSEVPKTLPDTFVLDPFLADSKTLTGIPSTRIQEFINRKYEPWAYSETKGPSNAKWTVIDPLAVRQRFDKVFGPHGIGWRIVPAPQGSSVSITPFTEKTRNGERAMYQVTLSAYCMEYRIRVGGELEWQRTSAFTDSSDSEDLGYAGGGAFSSLMKQALKMLGGYDHFIVPAKMAKAA